MQRRDVLRMLATGTALQLAPNKLLLVLREARTLLAAQPSLRTLNPRQEATVTSMAEMIIPKTDTPGATDVAATAFIDLILTDWCDDAERTSFLNGLADVDSRTQTLFGKNFVESSPVQQSQILVALGEEMMQQPEPTGRRRRRMLNASRPPSFYEMMRRLTLTAYYTSEAGATDELHFEIIPGRYQGCGEPAREKESIEPQ